MNPILEESFFFYRHKCRFAVQIDTQDQCIVLPIGEIGAITVPITLLSASPQPVIRHPDGQRCTILTDGCLRITKSYEAGLRRRQIMVADPGSWIVLPMHDNNPTSAWAWVPRPLEPNPILVRPSTVFAAINGDAART